MEHWKPIPSCEGYEASDAGRIRSIDRQFRDSLGRAVSVKGRVLAQTVAPNGYLRFRTGSGTRATHVAVLEAFVGPRPAWSQAAHNDGQKTNCALSNLRWATPMENAADKRLHGTSYRPTGESHPGAKLTEAQVRAILLAHHRGEKQRDIAASLGVDYRTVNSIVRGKSWGHVQSDMRAMGRVG